MLNLYHSNQVEKLVEKFIDVVGQPLDRPLAAEIVITQSQGMAHWLFVQLARKQTIAANIRFELPASFIWSIFHSQLDNIPENSEYDIDVLVWRILDCLPRCLSREVFQPLRHYLSEDDSELKRYQLALRIADVFDQYLIYRPQMVRKWEQQEDNDWQAVLWKELSANRDESYHRAALIEKFQRLCDENQLNLQRLPQRVAVFGVSAMPPAHLEVLYRLAERIEVHLFLFNPCLLYWGDIRDKKTQVYLGKKRKKIKRVGTDDYYTAGNTLLASWGKQGQEFINLIHDFSPYNEEELFVPHSGATLLTRIQSDILFLEDSCIPGESNRLAPKTIISDHDDSILIQVCHSTMREVQILHDQLLALFEKDPTLGPEDVVVMVPDIEKYAPYAEAVFGASGVKHKITGLSQNNHRPSLPCSIADRAIDREAALFNTFLTLLELPASRFTSTEILALLETPAVLRRFDLEVDDFEYIRLWVKECGVRWGADGASRAREGLPGFNANTWLFGLQRMLVGYAMAPTQTPFQEIMPYDQIEGGQASIMGKLYAFYEALLLFRDRLSQSYSIEQWSELLTSLAERFYKAADDEQAALLKINQIKNELVQQAGLAEFQDEITIDIIKDYFSSQFTRAGFQQRFFTGQITFCAMLPMRSIPFKVVCLVGMNDSEFPRNNAEPGFNRLKGNSMQGDRSRREDDRYLFLEALLSARQHLYISYVGNSIRDNHPMLPSVLVNELLDYIEQRFTLDADETGRVNDHTESGSIREKLVNHHPLQPFSRRYFDGRSRLFSYADEWVGSCAQLDIRKQIPEPFFSKPLEPSAEEMELVDFNQLIRFFKNPAEYFLKHRLAIQLPGLAEGLEESEPFNLDGLQYYVMCQTVLEHKLMGEDLEKERIRIKASGDLPQATFGDLQYEKIVENVEVCVSALDPYVNSFVDPLEVDLELNGVRLVGRLDGLTGNGQLTYRIAGIKAKDRIALWIRHLVLNRINPENCKLDSVHIGKDQALGFAPVKESGRCLEKLLDLYKQGLSQPLPFFPESSFAYVEAVQKDKNPDPGVLNAWEGNSFLNIPGESTDPYIMTAFRGVYPLEQRFSNIATAVFEPLLAAEADFTPNTQ